jgi:hypothetical protein
MSWELNLPIAIEQALQNCLAHGDTDIFPEPHIFQEWRKFPKQAIDATLSLHEFISSENDRAKFECIRSFVPSGPTGFRLGTQIEPIGNLYFLALTLLCAPNLELNRQTIQSRRVHSYRYQQMDTECRIFQPEIGWRSFQLQAKLNAEQFSHVVVCDIADFYRQIKPFSIANALAKSNCPVNLQMRLLQVLDLLDLSVSGLPIGGPASRILAEAVLSDVDANFANENMPYCRFVDDIRIFSDSQQVAFEHLLRVNEILYEKGFNLQKSKTRVLSTKEWLAESSFHAVFTPSKGKVENIEDLRKLLMIPSLDPYSEMRAQNDLRLEEFAKKNRFTDIIEISINNLAAIPSIIYGLLGLVLYLQIMHLPRSCAIVGGLTLFMLVLPIIIIATRNTIRSIPQNIRDGAYGLGASKLQVVLHHLLPFRCDCLYYLARNVDDTR